MASLADRARAREEQDDLDERRQRERAAAETRAQTAVLKRLLRAEAAREAYRQTIADYAPLLTVPTLERTPRLRDAPTHTWVLLLSDIHVGQRTEAEHTGELFEQSLALTREQFALLKDTLARLHHITSKSTRIERIVFLVLGDVVEGSAMRPSQATKIDGTATRQTVEASDLLTDLYHFALSLFPVVEVHNVGGNHDRVSPKPGDAGLGELGFHDTYAWLMGEFHRRMFRPAIDAGRFKHTNYESFFGGAIIAGHRFVFEHGASFKTSTGSYGGVSYYPIANAAAKYQQMLEGADFVCFGHFHKAMCLPMGRGWQVLNGSFPPSTHWVQSTFKSVHMPAQVLLDIHPEHGLVSWRPLYLPHEGLAKPGAYWDRLRAA